MRSMALPGDPPPLPRDKHTGGWGPIVLIGIAVLFVVVVLALSVKRNGLRVTVGFLGTLVRPRRRRGDDSPP